MTEKIKLTENDGIDRLLEEFNPSELDKAVKTVCPFYEPADRNFTGAYLDFHEYAKVGILTRLQIKLEDLGVCVEEETKSGRVDGSVHRLGLKDDDVYLYNDGKLVEKIALLEVKTGNIKPLQAAAYAYTEGTPAVIAEVKRGSCHLVDLSTAEKLLVYAANQLGALEELKDKNKRIPDPYKCESCTDISCEHWDGRNSSLETRYIIKKRTKQLSEHLSETVDELVDIVESLLREDNMSVERGETE